MLNRMLAKLIGREMTNHHKMASIKNLPRLLQHSITSSQEDLLVDPLESLKKNREKSCFFKIVDHTLGKCSAQNSIVLIYFSTIVLFKNRHMIWTA